MKNCDFLEGIAIISKCVPESEKNDTYGINLYHGEFMIGNEDWVTSDDDLFRLKELGWFIDDGFWACWV